MYSNKLGRTVLQSSSLKGNSHITSRHNHYNRYEQQHSTHLISRIMQWDNKPCFRVVSNENLWRITTYYTIINTFALCDRVQWRITHTKFYYWAALSHRVKSYRESVTIYLDIAITTVKNSNRLCTSFHALCNNMTNYATVLSAIANYDVLRIIT